MVLFGASGHAKVINDIIVDLQEELVHLFDDDENKKIFLNMNVTKYSYNIFSNEKLIISVGDNKLRKKISNRVQHKFGLLIHPSVVISKNVQIGKGTVVIQSSTIQADTIIGEHCIINTSSTVDHECRIENFVHISPNVTLCGNISIGEGTHVGTGAVILPNIKIGKWSKIGAGTVVISDVPDNVVVVGNPGKIIKRSE